MCIQTSDGPTFGHPTSVNSTRSTAASNFVDWSRPHGPARVRRGEVDYDSSSARLIVDVGGGNGSFLRGVLQQDRQPTGIIVDLPYMKGQAREEPASGLDSDSLFVKTGGRSDVDN